MRVLSLLLAASLCCSVLLFSDDASAQRLNRDWTLEDDSDPNSNVAEIIIDGTQFELSGQVEGVGTAGDLVLIGYVATEPTSVNADEKRGRVRQSGFSRLTFLIDSSVPARDLALVVSPEKCSIDGKVQDVKERGQIKVSCSGANIYSEMSADQEASIAAAFLENDRVRFKVNDDGSRGTLSIKLQGTAIQDE